MSKDAKILEILKDVNSVLTSGMSIYPDSGCHRDIMQAIKEYNASDTPCTDGGEVGKDLAPGKEQSPASLASPSFTKSNSIEQEETFWQGQDYIQSAELPKAEKLFEDNGLKLELTCGACPEQYDVYKQVGYLRLRHGEFRVDFPDCGGETIYEAEPKGDGIFEGVERMKYLSEAMKAILKKLTNVQNPEPSVATGDDSSNEAGNKKEILNSQDFFAERSRHHRLNAESLPKEGAEDELWEQVREIIEANYKKMWPYEELKSRFSIKLNT